VLSALLLLATATACPDAAVAEYELDYERAIAAYEACAKDTLAPRDKAPLFLRVGFLQLELGNESAARLVFRAALGYDPTIAPVDEVSPKSRAVFEDVRAELVSDPPVDEPAPEAAPAPAPETAASPPETAATAPGVGPWIAMGGGALALVVATGVYAAYYAGAGPPGPGESHEAFLARQADFEASRGTYEALYWSALGLSVAGAAAIGGGAWWAFSE
jgi:hypothetical protein